MRRKLLVILCGIIGHPPSVNPKNQDSLREIYKTRPEISISVSCLCGNKMNLIRDKE